MEENIVFQLIAYAVAYEGEINNNQIKQIKLCKIITGDKEAENIWYLFKPTEYIGMNNTEWFDTPEELFIALCLAQEILNEEQYD